MSYLFPVCLNKTEDKAPVHDRQQVIKKKGQACIEPFHQLQILAQQKQRDKAKQRAMLTLNFLKPSKI